MLLTTALLAVCGRRSPVTTFEPYLSFVTVGPNGLEQLVRIAPGHPVTADTLLIRSIIRNAGTDTVYVMAADDLGIGGTLELRIPSNEIHLNSGRGHGLAPGDSIVRAARRIVLSPAGRYVMTVRHATEPDFVAPVEIVVARASVP